MHLLCPACAKARMMRAVNWNNKSLVNTPCAICGKPVTEAAQAHADKQAAEKAKQQAKSAKKAAK